MKTEILTQAKKIKRNEILTMEFENKTEKGFVNIDTYPDNNETHVKIRKNDKFSNNIVLLERFFKTKSGAVNFIDKNI